MEETRNSLGRTIKNTIRLCMSIVCGVTESKYKQPKFLENTVVDSLYYHLTALIDQGKICDAENLMFERIDVMDKMYYYMILSVYEYLNEFNDEFLETNNFSRDEILEGIHSVTKIYDTELITLLGEIAE